MRRRDRCATGTMVSRRVFLLFVKICRDTGRSVNFTFLSAVFALRFWRTFSPRKRSISQKFDVTIILFRWVNIRFYDFLLPSREFARRIL